MVRVSNCIFISLNVVALSFGIITIALALHFHGNGITECQKVLKSPLLATGTCLSALSLIGLIGTLRKITILLWIYSFALFLWILGLFVFMIFTLVVTRRGGGEALTRFGFKKYGLGDYSNWLQKSVTDGKNWDSFKSCLVSSQVCSNLGDLKKVEDFSKKLTLLESGCCKPPTYCGFKYQNTTFWEVPKSGPAVPDRDCTKWSNDQTKLCYDCNSCKGGFLASIRLQWRTLIFYIAVKLMVSTFIFSVSCTTRMYIESDFQYNNV